MVVVEDLHKITNHGMGEYMIQYTMGSIEYRYWKVIAIWL